VLSTADAHGPVGRTVAYLNCELLTLLQGAGEVNTTVKLLVALFNPPTEAECVAQGLKAPVSTATAARVKRHSGSSKGFTMNLLGSQHSAFERLASNGEGR
jgi:hypothetical protein